MGIKFLAEVNDGYFRAKIWYWIKYTSIQNPPATKEEANSRNGINVNIQGFIKTSYDLMNLEST